MKKIRDSAQNAAASTSFAKTAGFVASTIRDIGKGVFYPIARSRNTPTAPEPGATPGIEAYLKEPGPGIPVRITTVDYGPDFFQSQRFSDVDAALQHPRQSGARVRWINVDGLDPSTVDRICRHYGVHTLAAEDVLNTYQRPKLEGFDDHTQIIVRQIQLQEQKLKNEQISFFLYKDTLISFQEEPGDVFDPVRRRLENSRGRFRDYEADYLFYALLDSIVDHIYPLLEGYGAAIEILEENISERPTPDCQKELFSLKRDLSLQRRVLWPLREVVDHLYRDDSDMIHEELRPFFRDVQDHATQVIDLLEAYRETTSGLTDLYQSSVGNRMNEIMKVLTIMASFFIPITFFAGVYGMNFTHMPELEMRYAYPVFWLICIGITITLAFFFKRKGWIGRGN
ncbi:MAG: magnesium/cobalt transporter CorA [Opitutales bacterium]